MKQKIKLANALIFLFVFLLLFLTQAEAITSQETLSQYMAILKKNPNDHALREKIIKYVQSMKPTPAIPEEVERYMSRGAAAVKAAKHADDFKDAAIEFEKASLVAPWLAAPYYNLGIVYDKFGKYGKAIQNLKLYLLADPDASDAKAVKNLIYEIEYRQEKAAKESSPEATAARKQKGEKESLKKLDNAKYIYYEVFRPSPDYARSGLGRWTNETSKPSDVCGIQGGVLIKYTIDIRNNMVVAGHQVLCDNNEGTRGPDFFSWKKDYESSLEGHEFKFPVPCEDWSMNCSGTGTINEDGNTIITKKINYRDPNKSVSTFTYARER